MSLDAAKKTQLEQRAVIGLLVVFLVVLVGAMKNTRIFRASRAPAPQTAALMEHVDMSKTLPETLKEHWQRMEPAPEIQTQALRPASAASSAPLYTAHHLRDPLQSLLPELPQPQTAQDTSGISQKAPVSQAPLPPLKVEGLWWETQQPRAIINGEVYGVGDQVSGATIKAIGRDGVTFEFDGRLVEVGITAGKAGGVGSQASRWR